MLSPALRVTMAFLDKAVCPNLPRLIRSRFDFGFCVSVLILITLTLKVLSIAFLISVLFASGKLKKHTG